MALTARDRAVLEALLPSRAHPALTRGVFDAGFESFHEDFELTALPSLRWSFRAALWAAAWVAPLLIFRLPPLTLHDPATRERALDAMACSRWYLLRQMTLVLKATVCFCYGADAAVRDAAGFPMQHDDPRRKP